MLGDNPLDQASAEFEALIDRWQRMSELCSELALHSITLLERRRYELSARQYQAAAALHFALLLRVNKMARKPPQPTRPNPDIRRRNAG